MRHEVIHETIVRDIVDVIDAVKNNDAIHGVRGNNNSFRSIAQASSALTLVFPVITSRNVNIETASLISRTIETKAVVMLRMLFSAMSIDDAKDGLEYIRKFHTNLNGKMTVDDYLDAMNRILESGHVSVDREQYDAIARDLRNIGNVLAESCSENSLNDYRVHPQVYGESTVVLEAPIYSNSGGKYSGTGSNHYDNYRQSFSPKATGSGKSYNNQGPKIAVDRDGVYIEPEDRTNMTASGRKNAFVRMLEDPEQQARRTNSREKDEKYRQWMAERDKKAGRKNDSNINAPEQNVGMASPKIIDKNGNVVPTNTSSSSSRSDNRARTTDYDSRSSFTLRAGGVSLLDSDIKKANDLMPTQMSLNFVSTSSGDPIETNLVIGIKAVIHGVSSSDLINRIVVKNEDNNGLLKLVRATTREISFCRDFLFAIEKAKIDALSQSRRGSSSKLWKVLERRSVKSKLLRSLRQNNSAAAISTLLFTQEEAELIKKAHNIDVNNPRVLAPIMESYNLMGVCLVDQTIEQASFMFDTGEEMFEDYSFTALERDNKKSDRNILNLLTKVAR